MSQACAVAVGGLVVDVAKGVLTPDTMNPIPNDHTEQEQQKAAEKDNEDKSGAVDGSKDDFKDLG